MRAILALFALAAALPLSAADRTSGPASELRGGAYPALLYFVDGNGGLGGEKFSDFAAALPGDAAARAAELKDLDSLLRGGRYDKGGERIRLEMGKLPGAQWRFVVLLERERRAIYARLGNGPAGNLLESVSPVRVEPRRCYERMDALMKAMAPVSAEPAFAGWRASELTANMLTVRDSRGLRDELYGGVHNAPCFVYDDGRAHAEIVADAWANSLTPSYTWWYEFDRGTHDYFYRSGGRDWCSDAAQEKAVRAQMEARRAAERKNAPAALPKSGTLDGIKGSGPF